MQTITEKTVDIEKVLRSKMGDKARWIPRFAVKWLKHIAHEDQVNEFLWQARDLKGTPWLVACLNYLGVKIEVEGRKVYLNHVPFLCYGGTYRDDATKVWQLFGHVHTNDRSTTEGKDDKRLVMRFPTQYDVGVDNNDFRPISWKEVKEKIEAQIAASNSLKTEEGE